MIQFSNITLTAASKGTLHMRARVQYDGSRGYPVRVAARAVIDRQGYPWVTAPPLIMERGFRGGWPVDFTLRFDSADPAAPYGGTTNGVELGLALPTYPPFYKQRVDYVRQWVRDFADVRAADLDRLPFAATPLSAEQIRGAYDWDDNGAWLAVRPHGGGRVLLVVQPGPELTVMRWTYFPPDDSVPLIHNDGYTVRPGGRVDAATGTVLPGDAPSDAPADFAWDALGPAASQARPRGPAQLALWRTPVMVPVAATRVFARGNPLGGTTRDWTLIRDLFDNCNEEPYRENWCVDNIWSAAGIELRIVLRRDIRVEANLAYQLPATALHTFAREHNVQRMLNVYFLRQVEGARAWGAPDRNPGLLNQDGGLWVGDRCEPGDTTCWRRDVITVAHESGHFLNLGHLCDDLGPASPCEPGDEQYLMYGAGTRPESQQLMDSEIFRARERAWMYRP
jgi:hypothetical protein